jgi:hypothetical protein
MVVTLFPMVTLVRLEQSKKAPSPMLVTLSGMVTLVRPQQLLKALPPMLVTLSGTVMLVRLEQLKKALSSMLSTLFPMVTLVRPVHLSKACSPMLVRVSGRMTPLMKVLLLMMLKLLPDGEEAPATVLPVAAQAERSRMTYFSDSFTALLMVAHTPLAEVSLVLMTMDESSLTVCGVTAVLAASLVR